MIFEGERQSGPLDRSDIDSLHGTDTLQRLYASLIASTPNLVDVFDRDYHFAFANRALLELSDRTVEDSVGYEPWHAEIHERESDQVIATVEPIRGEVGFPRASLSSLPGTDEA